MKRYINNLMKLKKNLIKFSKKKQNCKYNTMMNAMINIKKANGH